MTEPRFALLIAQEQYQELPTLDAPSRGVLSLRELLEECDFQTDTLGVEVNRRRSLAADDLRDALAAFAEKARGAKNAHVIFYFAGHAVVLGDEVYLLCEAATLDKTASIVAGGIRLSEVVTALNRLDGGCIYIIIDACRSHPDPLESQRLRRSVASEDLRPILERRRHEVYRGLLIFSASDGQIVKDDAGQGHSLFTRELIEQLKLPGLQAWELMRRVSDEVRDQSNHTQRPVIVHGRVGSFVFHPLRANAQFARAGTLALAPRSNVSDRVVDVERSRSGPIVLVAARGSDEYAALMAARSCIRLSCLQPTGWSLNPIAMIDLNDEARASDYSAAFATILMDAMTTIPSVTIERKAWHLLATFVRSLARLADPTLRNLAQLDRLWAYLCRIHADPTMRPGGFLGHPAMGIALWADRLAAVNAIGTGEFQAFKAFLTTDEDHRDEVARFAMQPLHALQFPPYQTALSPGNIDLVAFLSDPNAAMIIELEPSFPPSAKAVAGLWLAAIRMMASRVRSRPPATIAVRELSEFGYLPFQSSAVDDV